MSRSVLMLEFNELSPVLMDRFISAGHLPNFARLRDRSAAFITEAGEVDGRLNPWVQWVTVHTGATAAEHGIEKLGEARRLTVPTIADLVSAAGGVVWQCGSMNVQPLEPVNGCVLPDPWSVDADPQPASLEPFFRFVSANVQEHTNAAAPLSKREAIAFARFLATHGLSVRTALATLRQLVGERTGRVPRWQRAELLDRFQWDVFAYYHRRLRPTFATFFSNSTAHFQHLHWDELDRVPDESAVLHGYRQMDRLVARATALVGPDTTVVLCTALSQTANHEDDGYDGFYRPHNLGRLVDALGVVGVVQTAPMMAGQSHVYFDSASAASAGAASLGAITVAGQRAFDIRQNGADLVIGIDVFARLPAGSALRWPEGREASFDELFYWSDSPREGTHHGDGILWIEGDPNRAPEARVPLTSVAPTLLSLIGVEPPPSMKREPLTVGHPSR